MNSNSIHVQALRPTHEVIEQITAVLKAAGFEFRFASMDSEACYYGLPGCPEQLRVASHGKSRGYPGSPPIVARITVAPNSKPHPGKILISSARLTDLINRAVGKYFLVVSTRFISLTSKDQTNANR